MAIAGRRSRRFVIVKRFMGNYNVYFPHGGLSVQIRSHSRRNIKGGGGRAFTALFIRSAHKRRFTVLTLPYSLFFFLSLSLLALRSFPVGCRPWRTVRHRRGMNVSSFAIRMAICFGAIRRKDSPFLRHGGNNAERSLPPFLQSVPDLYTEACFQIII